MPLHVQRVALHGGGPQRRCGRTGLASVFAGGRGEEHAVGLHGHGSAPLVWALPHAVTCGCTRSVHAAGCRQEKPPAQVFRQREPAPWVLGGRGKPVGLAGGKGRRLPGPGAALSPEPVLMAVRAERPLILGVLTRTTLSSAGTRSQGHLMPTRSHGHQGSRFAAPWALGNRAQTSRNEVESRAVVAACCTWGGSTSGLLQCRPWHACGRSYWLC